MKPRFLLPVLLLIGALCLPAASVRAAPTSEQQALIREYESAMKTGDPVRIKNAWNDIIQEYPHQNDAINDIAAHADPETAGHFAQRTGIENMNAEHRAQAGRGEIVPFEEVQGERFNERFDTPPDPTKPKKVAGDPSLADLAEPGTPHEARPPVKDEGLADLVKESEAKAADPEAQRQIAEERARRESDYDAFQKERSREYDRIDDEVAREQMLEEKKKPFRERSTRRELKEARAEEVDKRFKEADQQLQQKQEKMKAREAYKPPAGEATGVHGADAPAGTRIEGPEGSGGAANRLSGEEENRRTAGDAEEQKLLPAGEEQKLLPAGEEKKMLPAGEERKMLPAGEERKLLPASTEPESPGAKVLEDVSADTITPEDGSHQLKQLDTTPEAVLRETRGYGETGPKRTSAPETVVETETRVDFSESDMTGVSGKAIQTVDSVTDVADWGGWAVEAVHKEEIAAAKEGREFSKWNATMNGLKGLAAGQTFENFKKHGEAAKARAESTGESKFLAGLTAWGSATGEFLHNAATGVYNMHVQYQKEEMEEEIARAQSVGDAADPWRAKIEALMRVMGDVLPVNKFTEFWADDSLEELRTEAQMRMAVERRTKAAVEVGLAEFGVLERRLRAELLKANGEITDEVLALQKQYHDRMSALQDLRDELKSKGLIKEGDPEWTAINQSVDLLDSNVVDTTRKDLAPEIEANRAAQSIRADIARCDLGTVDERTQAIADPSVRAAVTAEIASLRGTLVERNALAAKAHGLETSGDLAGARTQYAQALNGHPCEKARGELSQRLTELSRKIQTDEAVQKCFETAGAEAVVTHSTGAVACRCPEDHILDPKLNMCVIDRAKLDRRLEDIQRGTTAYEPAYTEPASYLPQVPSYEEEQREFAMQNQMFNQLQNMNNQAYANSQQGINLNQMYGSMASGGSQWSDPTNTASGGFYRPAGYATHTSGAPAGFGTSGATPAYQAPASSYSSGPGQGEFSGGGNSAFASSGSSNQDWCPPAQRTSTGCRGVSLG